MSSYAASPTDLETLLEDAFVLRDHDALSRLFEPGAVVAGHDGQLVATEAGDAVWRTRQWTAPRRIVECAQTALVVGGGAASVLRRGEDGSWRYAIFLTDDEGLPS